MSDKVHPQNQISTTKEEFLNRLLTEVQEERKTEREKAREELTEKSLRELRYSDISVLSGIEVLREIGGARDEVQIQVPETSEGQSPDIRSRYEIFCQNEVLLQGEKDGESIQIEGTVVEIDDPMIKIQAKNGARGASKIKQKLGGNATNVSLGVLLNAIPYNRQIETLQLMRRGGEDLADILMGNRPLEFSHNPVCNTRHRDEDLYENEKQKRGIEKALQAEDLACLHGPPGTGKTRVIIEIARRLVAADHDVLIAAETNAAVDNILVGSSDSRTIDDSSLLYFHNEGNVRVARTNLSSELTHPVAREELKQNNPQAADIVVSTNSSAKPMYSNRVFDYVIIDEASQATIQSSLIPLGLGHVAVLVGDHKQLPPFSLAHETPQKSLFEHLYADDGIYGKDIGTRFDTQYRMDEAIAGFSSQEFYEGSLKTADSAAKIRKDLSSKPIGMFDVPGENETGGQSKANPKEAECVGMQLEMLIRNEGLTGGNIGVAAAYRQQIEEIATQTEELDLPGVSDVKIDTFDSFQGSERDAMVLSFTRSNSQGNIGFLGNEIGERRLNVAITRAKRYCALVGDWGTLKEGSALYERLYQYVTDHAPPTTVRI